MKKSMEAQKLIRLARETLSLLGEAYDYDDVTEYLAKIEPKAEDMAELLLHMFGEEIPD